MGQTSLVLASASPRRRELLAQLGLAFEVAAADIDEAPAPGEPPERYVERVAREKAELVSRRRPAALVLAADTEVVLEGEVLGKPRDPEHARAMLRRLSGRAHRVMSAVALAGTCAASRRVETNVRFRELSDAELHWYVQTGEPMDKAGGYAIQGKGAAFVAAVEGSVSNVIGLPLAETLELLASAGHPLPWSER